MYSPRRSYGSPPPELSNNPFIDHPANALTRYPDIAGTDDPTGSSGEYTSWLQHSGSPLASNMAGYPGQGATIGYGTAYQQPQLQPQQTAWNGGSGFVQSQQGYGSPIAQFPQTPGQPFQPSSSFGQQLVGQVNGAYSGLPQPQSQPQFTGYPSSPQYGAGYQSGYLQQAQPTTPYLSEFDPYAQSTSSSLGSSQAGGQYRPQHPREYVQQHKAELESWDAYSWKQAQNTFDALKEAWGVRKREIETRVRAMGGAGLFGGGGYGGMYGGQAQEIARLESLAKEAESNFDSVAASSFQMHEVYTGYRQSGDLASKRRVRESINAALVSLPEWPAQTF
ncbi:hypothetical protein AcW1_008101 [Taiwanofungus camphoratus]|nr:hypothetical protein AcW1_008101 [Antrodia cinnamomea]